MHMDTKMNKETKFESVWDALEDDPIRRQNLKLRSELMVQITEKLRSMKITQTEASKILHITQPRVSALIKGKIESFRLDSLGASPSKS